MARRVIMGAYGAWMITLMVIIFVVAPGPTATAVFWGVAGLSSTAAILAGAWLHRPRRVMPWLVVAAAIYTYTAGDVVYYLTDQQLGPTSSWRHVDDVFYGLMLLLTMIGLLLLARSAAPDRGAAIDALILMCGVGILTWIFLVEGTMDQPQRDQVDAITTIAYPLGDVVILAAVTRLLTAARWTTTATLFVTGTLGLLVADALYRLLRTDGTWTVPRAVGLGWFAFYAFWGAAALHPSMRVLTEPRRARVREINPLSLPLLALSAMIPPAVLLYEAIAHGPVRHGVVIAVASAAMFLLVLVRLAEVGGQLRERIARERGLRGVIAALVSAADTAAVTAALDKGVRQLMPEEEFKLQLISSGDDVAETRLGDLRTDQLLATADLPGPVAAQLGTFATTLACPLVLQDHPMGEDYLGVLLVAAPEASLVGTRDSLAVLASQAALALDRVALSRELIRRNSEEYFRALVHHTADVILILCENDRIRYASPSAAAVFGTANLVGVPLLDLVDDADRDTATQALALVRAGGAEGVPANAGAADWTVHARDGTPVQVEASWRDLRDDPSVRGIVVTLRDVTEQRRLERELTHRAYHDALTGLANRVLFAERIQEAITQTHYTGAVAGVLLIDLDDFKMVNDTLGHEVGDRLLLDIGHRLTELIRPRDTAARLGGDEFAVLIQDAHDPASVEEIAARIAAALREPFPVGGQLLNGTASIGIGTTADADDGPDLLRQADLALYVAKDAGKGQWRRYQPHLHKAVAERMTLRSELDAAITHGQLAVEYQPMVALADGSTSGFEALVRWNHPTRGRLLPDAFIDVAEDTGLVVPMGDWVLHTALGAAALWRDSWPDNPPYISVNVSVPQFRAPGFVARVARELTVSRVPARCLMLEITESLLLRDDDQVWDDLAVLRQIGIRVAIDDFGTGYSSLSYLRHVPLDVLKIDRLFTAAMSTSPQQRALVDGIVRLAHTLGLRVIAEGIETPAERELLTKIGCPYGQGFLFSRPMPLEETLLWLQREHITAV